MMVNNQPFAVSFNPYLSFPHAVSVTIPEKYTLSLYNFLIDKQQKEARAVGFSKGNAPRAYIENVYQPMVIEQIGKFFFSHAIQQQLHDALLTHRLVIAGQPELIAVQVQLDKESYFHFRINPIEPVQTQDWKRTLFKAPQRKNYKDLDRQVETFLKDEEKNGGKKEEIIQVGDWVCFDYTILDENNNSLLPNYKSCIWLRIGDEEVDDEIRILFEGKQVGDVIVSSHKALQEYVDSMTDDCYRFLIVIMQRIPNSHFSLDLFKKHFKLKSAREVHQKLIEVFSFRNDVSQRRETVEAVYRLLLSSYEVELPSQLIDEQQHIVLNAVHRNPDYYVYKAQRNFKNNIRALAIKQLKEAILTDYLAFEEDIQLTQEDICCYLNLLKRPRTKEFIYFELPPTKINGQEAFVPFNILHKACLREKTLNYLIYYLTKR